jgi:hypothetical protein
MPLSPDGAQLPGAGTYKVVSGTDVAANTEFSHTVPTGKLWVVKLVSVRLVQGATQTPRPSLLLDDGGGQPFVQSIGSSAVQAASTNCIYQWFAGTALTGQVGVSPDFFSQAPIPDGLQLPAGYRLRSVTGGIGANSNYEAPRFYVVEFSV